MPFGERVREALIAPRYRTFASISMLASLFVPGLGSVINGDRLRGAVFLTGFVLSALLLGRVVEVIAMFGFWVFSMVDAYEGALD
jgi:hypothetical protein